MRGSGPPIFGFKVSYSDNTIIFENKMNGKMIYGNEILSEIFDLKKYNIPYTNRDYQHDWKVFISMCLSGATAYKTFCARAESAKDVAQNLPYTYISSGDAMRHINSVHLGSKPTEIWSALLAEVFSHIKSRENATEASENIPRLMQLSKLLKLSDFACFALQCAFVCKTDRGFEKVFKTLQGENPTVAPTLGIIQTLYSLTFPNCEADWFFDQMSFENRLLFNSTTEFDLMRPITLRPGAFSYIIGKPYKSRKLSSYIVKFPDKTTKPLYIDKQLQLVHGSFKAMYRQKEPHLCILSGAAGIGKKSTIQYLAEEENAKLILIDLDKTFPTEPQLHDIMDELLFLALIEGAKLCFIMKDLVSNVQTQYIFEMAKEHNLGIFFLTESTRYNTPDGYILSCIDYPPLDLENSPKFWKLFSEEYDISSGLNWTQMASRYMLTPGQIKSAIRNASEMAKSQNTTVSEEMINSAVLLGSTGRLSAIADRINVVYTWDDLMLDDMPKQMLMETCNRIKHRHTVEIQWGGKFAYGNGVSILLYGPPGTGKTMSAQVIANELSLPLYRINLSQIISKYIGETAKNINSVFNEAKSSNVILFFDEADSLFAKRTDVKNSNDRHANSDSSYLLQKIEEYSGISILATNLANSFDEAFRRRINYMINIHMPGVSQRLELWKRCLPSKAPLSDDVDLKLLADKLEFSGSVIRSAALQAAYFAAGENTSISMIHLAKAVRLELWKLGMSEPYFLTMNVQNQSKKLVMKIKKQNN
ncbi:MAG: ATP-binding protein [Defluviitaleaceae bacterium]|nr:ATP-binding protein [Defluviitaleaceae bacterium]